MKNKKVMTKRNLLFSQPLYESMITTAILKYFLLVQSLEIKDYQNMSSFENPYRIKLQDVKSW